MANSFRPEAARSRFRGTDSLRSGNRTNNKSAVFRNFLARQAMWTELLELKEAVAGKGLRWFGIKMPQSGSGCNFSCPFERLSVNI